MTSLAPRVVPILLKVSQATFMNDKDCRWGKTVNILNARPFQQEPRATCLRRKDSRWGKAVNILKLVPILQEP